jgi:hypothetical protein
MSEHRSQRSTAGLSSAASSDRRNHDRHHDHGWNFSSAVTNRNANCKHRAVAGALDQQLTISPPFRETLSRKSSRPEIHPKFSQLATSNGTG